MGSGIIEAVDGWFSVVKRISMPHLLGPKGYLHGDAKLPVSYGFLYPNLLVRRLSLEELFMTGGNPHWYFRQTGRN